MTDAQLRALIREAAQTYGVQPELVAAVVQVESSGNPWAWNPEPRYRYLWDVRKRQPFRTLTSAEQNAETPPIDFRSIAGDRDQEWWAQQASWGLMQVMGAVAREHGSLEPFLTQLCDPVVNLAIGCRVLLQLLLWAEGHLEKAIGAYNAGRGGWDSDDGRHYAAKVLAKMREVTI